MAIAASLNVNLTATSGQFTSTMTKAAGTMKKVGATAKTLSGAVRSFVAFESIKKAVNFVARAVAEIDELAVAAARVGVSLSRTDVSKINQIKAAASRAADSVDAIRLQFVLGLAPAIAWTAGIMEQFITQGIGGFSTMRVIGESVGTVVIVIGKAIQVVANALNIVGNYFTVMAADIIRATAAVAEFIGELEKADELRYIADSLERNAVSNIMGDLGEWEDIFAWPEMKDTADLMIGKMNEIGAAKKELEVPQGIKLGTGADAIFGYRQKQMRIDAKNNPQAAANKQVQLITETNRKLAELIRLQGTTTVVTA